MRRKIDESQDLKAWNQFLLLGKVHHPVASDSRQVISNARLPWRHFLLNTRITWLKSSADANRELSDIRPAPPGQVRCRTGKMDLVAITPCSAADLLRYHALGSFSTSAHLLAPSSLLLQMWTKPLSMHSLSTWCLLAKGVSEWGLLQRIKKTQKRIGEVSLAFFFLQCLRFTLCLCPDEISLILCCFVQHSPCGYGEGAPSELWCQQDFAVDRCAVVVVGISTFLWKMYWKEFPVIYLTVGECSFHWNRSDTELMNPILLSFKTQKRVRGKSNSVGDESSLPLQSSWQQQMRICG